MMIIAVKSMPQLIVKLTDLPLDPSYFVRSNRLSIHIRVLRQNDANMNSRNSQ